MPQKKSAKKTGKEAAKKAGPSKKPVVQKSKKSAPVKKAAPKLTAEETDLISKFHVTFARSGKVSPWKPALGSILELADELGIKIESGCRAGNCGSCLVAIKSGAINYVGGHGASSEDGSCLTCICKPKTDLVLDA